MNGLIDGILLVVTLHNIDLSAPRPGRSGPGAGPYRRLRTLHALDPRPDLDTPRFELFQILGVNTAGQIRNGIRFKIVVDDRLHDDAPVPEFIAARIRRHIPQRRRIGPLNDTPDRFIQITLVEFILPIELPFRLHGNGIQRKRESIGFQQVRRGDQGQHDIVTSRVARLRSINRQALFVQRSPPAVRNGEKSLLHVRIIHRVLHLFAQANLLTLGIVRDGEHQRIGHPYLQRLPGLQVEMHDPRLLVIAHIGEKGISRSTVRLKGIDRKPIAVEHPRPGPAAVNRHGPISVGIQRYFRRNTVDRKRIVGSLDPFERLSAIHGVDKLSLIIDPDHRNNGFEPIPEGNLHLLSITQRQHITDHRIRFIQFLLEIGDQNLLVEEGGYRHRIVIYDLNQILQGRETFVLIVDPVPEFIHFRAARQQQKQRRKYSCSFKHMLHF